VSGLINSILEAIFFFNLDDNFLNVKVKYSAVSGFKELIGGNVEM